MTFSLLIFAISFSSSPPPPPLPPPPLPAVNQGRRMIITFNDQLPVARFDRRPRSFAVNSPISIRLYGSRNRIGRACVFVQSLHGKREIPGLIFYKSWPTPNVSSQCAFLYQILVTPTALRTFHGIPAPFHIERIYGLCPSIDLLTISVNVTSRSSILFCYNPLITSAMIMVFYC